MTREYVRQHLQVVAKVFSKRQPLPDEVIELITDKLMRHPDIKAGNEFQLGEGCRHYVEEVNNLIEAKK